MYRSVGGASSTVRSIVFTKPWTVASGVRTSWHASETSCAKFPSSDTAVDDTSSGTGGGSSPSEPVLFATQQPPDVRAVQDDYPDRRERGEDRHRPWITDEPADERQCGSRDDRRDGGVAGEPEHDQPDRCRQPADDGREAEERAAGGRDHL